MTIYSYVRVGPLTIIPHERGAQLQMEGSGMSDVWGFATVAELTQMRDAMNAFLESRQSAETLAELAATLPDVTEGGTLVRCDECGGMCGYDGDGHTHTCHLFDPHVETAAANQEDHS